MTSNQAPMIVLAGGLTGDGAALAAAERGAPALVVDTVKETGISALDSAGPFAVPRKLRTRLREDVCGGIVFVTSRAARTISP
jgi:hypothetical protein